MTSTLSVGKTGKPKCVSSPSADGDSLLYGGTDFLICGEKILAPWCWDLATPEAGSNDYCSGSIETQEAALLGKNRVVHVFSNNFYKILCNSV